MRCHIPALMILLALDLNGRTFEEQFAEIRAQATREELYSLLWSLPKGGDIHNHFSLSVPAEVWWRYATEENGSGNEFYTRTRFSFCPGDLGPRVRFQNIQRSTWRALSPCRQGEYVPLRTLSAALRAEWLSSLKLDRPGEGRDEFFERIVLRLGEISHDPIVAGNALAATLKQISGEGIRYLETQLSPASYQDADGNRLAPEKGAQVIRDVLNRPDVKATGIETRFQFTLVRFRPDAEQMLEVGYRFVDRNRDLWKGINLVGREDNDKGYALRFLDTFRKMRREYGGIHLSIHGGEKDSPGSEVRDTLLLGAERIGHGINLISDPEAMLLARTGKILVETQLISNQLLEYTPDLSTHPFPEYLRTGIPVCLNTDDPGAWDSNLTDEYFTAVTNFNLRWEEVVQLGRNSLAYSFAEPELKRVLLESYDKDVREFEKRMMGDWRAALKAVHAHPSGYARRTLRIGTRE